MIPHSRQTLVRRSIGIGTLLLSLLGLLLCAAVAAGAWAGKRELDRVNVALFGAADDAFELLETRLDRVTQKLGASRQRVSGIPKLVEQLNTARVDARAEAAPLLQSLDDMFEQLKSADDALASSEAIARGVNRVSASLASSREADSDDESAGVHALKVAELSATVADALSRLQAMRQELIELRESGQLAREFAAGLLTRMGELDGRLANASTRIDRLKADVSTARRSAADLGRRVHRWTVVAAVTLVLLALWFAISQAAMVKSGWRLARSSRRGEESETPPKT